MNMDSVFRPIMNEAIRWIFRSLGIPDGWLIWLGGVALVFISVGIASVVYSAVRRRCRQRREH